MGRATTEQKVDFLLKKVGYSLSKTGSVSGTGAISGGTTKEPFNESLPSPFVIPDSSIWTQSLSIPTTPPGSDTSIVKVYLSGASGLRMTADSTVSGSRAFIAYTTYNNTSSARLTDWIDTQFGSGYVIKVYKGDPNSGGVSLDAAGSSGNDDTWFFDYSSGVLNFNGDDLPSGVTDTNIYIVGYRYIGTKGVSAPGQINPTNLYTSGIATFVGDVYANSNLTVTGLSTFTGAIDSNGGIDISGGSGLNVTGHTELDFVNVSAASTFAGNIDANGNLDVDGQTDLDVLNVSDTATFSGLVDINHNLDVDGHTELDFVNVSAASTFAGIVDVNGTLNVDGHVEADDINVSGMTSLAQVEVGDIAANNVVYAGTGGRLKDSTNLKFTDTTSEFEVVGHSVLDTVVASGIVTAAQFSTGASGVGINITGSQITGPEELVIDPAAVGVNTGKVRIKGDLYVDGTSFVVHEGDIEFGDFVVGIASTVPTNALLDGAGIGIGSTGIRKFIRYNHASTSLQSSIDFSVLDAGAFKAGTNTVLNKTTLGPTVTKSSLETLGTLQDLDVTGISTFARIIVGSAVTANSTGVFVTGVTTSTSLVAGSAKVSDLTATRVVFSGTAGELEDSNSLTFDGCCLNVTGPVKSTMLNVSGVSTTGGLLDINAGGQANTFKVEDLTAGRVVLAGTGGEIEDSANLKFTGSDLIVGTGVTANNSGVIVSGVTTSISFVGPLTGNSTTATDLSINATQRLLLQTGNNATDVLASGNAGQVLQSAGSGNAPAWVNAAAAGAIEGITVRQNGSVVGSANSISTLNFLGNAVSVDAAVLAGIATVTVEAEDPVAMAIALG